MTIPSDVREAMRKFNTMGVVSSGRYKPKKADLIALISALSGADTDLAVAITAGGGALVVDTTAGLSDLAWAAGKLAFVLTGTGAGVYKKVGASGTGSWAITDLVLTSEIQAQQATQDDRLDAVEAALPGKASTTALSSEQSRAEAAEAALDSRLDTVEAALPGKASTTALSSEQSRAEAAEAALDNRLDTVESALPGKADLVGGKVPSSQLPAYVDDILEYANVAALPGTGASGLLYVTLDTNLTYRWSGSAYVEVSKSLGLGTTSSTAFAGDRGAALESALASEQTTRFDADSALGEQIAGVAADLSAAEGNLYNQMAVDRANAESGINAIGNGLFDQAVSRRASSAAYGADYLTTALPNGRLCSFRLADGQPFFNTSAGEQMLGGVRDDGFFLYANREGVDVNGDPNWVRYVCHAEDTTGGKPLFTRPNFWFQGDSIFYGSALTDPATQSFTALFRADTDLMGPDLDDREVVLMGIPGQMIFEQVETRFGTAPFTVVVPGGVIPADGSAVACTVSDQPLNASVGSQMALSIKGYGAGADLVLAINTSSAYTIRRLAAGTAITTSSLSFTLNPEGRDNWIFVLGTGTNDVRNPGVSVEMIIDAVKRIRDRQRSEVKKFIWVGPIMNDAQNDTAGNSVVAKFNALRAAAVAEFNDFLGNQYGSFFDLYKEATDNARTIIEWAGGTWEAGDAAQVAAGKIPAKLLGPDIFHPNGILHAWIKVKLKETVIGKGYLLSFK